MKITTELRQAIAEAGNEPVRIEDPDTHTAYVLVRAEVYDRMRAPSELEEIDPSFFEIDDFEPAVRILDRLPIGNEPLVLFVGAEAVTIKRYQIAAWASLNDATRPFPILIDTGHSHNFSITESFLRRWANLSPDDLRFLGTTRLKGDRLNQYRAGLRLHQNRPGTMELGNGHHPMTLDEGISIVPEGTIRLPLLGLRAIVQNGLRLVLDGKRRHVTLKTGWF